MTSKQLASQYRQRAHDEIAAGGYCSVDSSMPTVDVVLSDGSEYFFQGHEADSLIEETPEWIHPEDYILAMAQNW